MYRIFLAVLCLILTIVAQNSTVLYSEYSWLSLPATHQLPLPHNGKYANINGIRIWYTIYGSSKGIPVLFLHGGFANSDYWGLQIKELKSVYRCILMDSRGQGRSTMSSSSITYGLMSSDVIALLNYLNIEKVNLIGWSDGAIIGLNIAMKYQNRLNSLFAFAANYNYIGVNDITTSSVFTTYLQRSQSEYEKINPENNYTNLYNNMMTIWSTTPNWSQQNFTQINNSLPIWIVDADHEEAIYRK